MSFFKRFKKKEKKAEKGMERQEGKLAVDVYDTETAIVVIAPISNAKKDSLDISAEKNLLNISGEREAPEEGKNANGLIHRECYWGRFSREIVLPEEVDSFTASASFKDGIIKVNLPKMRFTQRRRIVVSEEA